MADPCVFVSRVRQGLCELFVLPGEDRQSVEPVIDVREWCFETAVR